MTPGGTLALAGALLVLAALPSASVVLVVTRAATAGFRQGAAVAAGIVLGDLVFMTLAVVGLKALAQSLGSFFTLVRIAGGAYVIWIGLRLWRARGIRTVPHASGRGGWSGSFAAGLALTLGDVKAIVFYASFLPAFVEVGRVGPLDLLLLAMVTVGAVGGVKLAYAAGAQRLAARFAGRWAAPGVQRAAGTALVATGAYVALRP